MTYNKFVKWVLLLSIVSVFLILPPQADAASSVTIKGGQITEGRTLVPLRAIFEEIGATVHYENKTKKITATKDGRTILLTVGSRHTYINGQHNLIDVPAKVVNGQTLVPLRFISESFGGSVRWDQQQYKAFISLPDKQITVEVTRPFVQPSKSELRNFLKKAANAQFNLGDQQYYTRAQIDARLSPYFTKSFIDNFLHYRWEYDVINGERYYYFYGSDDLYLYVESEFFFNWDYRTKVNYTQNQSNYIITLSENVPAGDIGIYYWEPFTYRIQLVKGIYSTDGYKINAIHY
ncbi:copper amine oxidase N-terminal domain-containing protein [Alkalihalophilus marmarensis]|uniref:copper amine oxidase N-terminal domain-containing protein n=1 Tax=Alkalihalophilus marmarensis TaxID=521377 RepID=UPI002DBF2FFC|nr:copper amine oxidase N-terminal domain-containing protein [Alkalihalophilus marmarensis]MEC2071327.1 copper amine oxidase N-terminal domain-containing protein [Alkalihalophilus marmarensis]